MNKKIKILKSFFVALMSFSFLIGQIPFATPVFATTDPLVRQFESTISPTVSSGGDTQEYTITITNTSTGNGDAKARSVNVAIPSGFVLDSSVVASNGWDITTSATDIKAKKTGPDPFLNPSEFFTLVFDAIAPISSGDYEWTVNLYKGDGWTGEEFAITTSQPTVTAEGEEPVLGCTDDAAINFDEEATEDNDSCLYTGTLTVTKVVVDGILTVEDFPLYVDGFEITSGEATTTLSGAHIVSEDGDEDYEAVFSGDCDSEGNVTVPVNGDAFCTITNTYNGEVDPDPTDVTINLTKIVCDDESYLPNWGISGATVTETTASEFLAEGDNAEHCSLAEGWDFQWQSGKILNSDDNDVYGEVGGWTTVGSTNGDGEVSVDIDVTGITHISVREVLEEGYIPFTFWANGKLNSDDVSAELYCGASGGNYDNMEWIKNVEVGDEYYCVAFNASEESEGPAYPYGIITNPLTDDVVSGTIDLTAEYYDGDEDNDDAVQWAVRSGTSCTGPENNVFGNVNGMDDDYDWDGSSFSSEFDSTQFPNGDYCFIFNPTDDGEVDVRETVLFSILNEVEEPHACTPDLNIVANGGFELPVVEHASKWNIFPNGTEDLGWNVVWLHDLIDEDQPEVALLEIHRGVLGWLASEGEQWTELDSSWYGPDEEGSSEDTSVKIYQELPTVIGETYTLSFDFSSRPGTDEEDNGFKVYWEGGLIDSIVEDGSENDNTDWDTHTYVVEATSDNSELRFADSGDGNGLGSFLDNVSVTCEEASSAISGRLDGTKYYDSNSDGSFDSEEENILINWIIKLYNSSWELLDTDETNESGDFNFNGLSEGTYRVCEYQADGWTQTDPVTDGRDHVTIIDNASPNVETEGVKCYEVVVSAENEETGGLKFGNVDQSEGGGGNEDAILGCTDPEANNHDAEATQDNGSCEYNTATISGGFVGFGTSGGGEVLGAATGICDPLLNSYLFMNANNSIEQVARLQGFLSLNGFGSLINGVFDGETENAVRSFQTNYSEEVLKPWVALGLLNDGETTGQVYKTTRWKINDLFCPGSEAFPVFP